MTIACDGASVPTLAIFIKMYSYIIISNYICAYYALSKTAPFRANCLCPSRFVPSAFNILIEYVVLFIR